MLKLHFYNHKTLRHLKKQSFYHCCKCCLCKAYSPNIFQTHLVYFTWINPTPTFLGVIFDRTLFFSKHVSSLKANFFPRLKALCCLSASSWGPSKDSFSVLYKAFLRAPCHIYFTRMVSFLKRYQYYLIGTPPPSG